MSTVEQNVYQKLKRDNDRLSQALRLPTVVQGSYVAGRSFFCIVQEAADVLCTKCVLLHWLRRFLDQYAATLASREHDLSLDKRITQPDPNLSATDLLAILSTPGECMPFPGDLPSLDDLATRYTEGTLSIGSLAQYIRAAVEGGFEPAPLAETLVRMVDSKRFFERMRISKQRHKSVDERLRTINQQRVQLSAVRSGIARVEADVLSRFRVLMMRIDAPLPIYESSFYGIHRHAGEFTWAIVKDHLLNVEPAELKPLKSGAVAKRRKKKR